MYLDALNGQLPPNSEQPVDQPQSADGQGEIYGSEYAQEQGQMPVEGQQYAQQYAPEMPTQQYNQPQYAQEQYQQPAQAYEQPPQQEVYPQPYPQDFQPQPQDFQPMPEQYPASQQEQYVPPQPETYQQPQQVETPNLYPTMEAETIRTSETPQLQERLQAQRKEGELIFVNPEISGAQAQTGPGQITTQQVVSKISGYPVNPAFTTNPLAALVQQTASTADPSQASTWQASIVHKIVLALLKALRAS